MPLTIDTASSTAAKIFYEDNANPADRISQARAAGGGVLQAFSDPFDELNLLSRAGQKLDLNIFEPFGGTVIYIGSFDTPADNPDVINAQSMVAGSGLSLFANRSIGESGDDIDADLVASGLILSAGTGIGAGNTLEIQADGLEAATTTGGIDLVDLIGVRIGALGVSAGLRVATSGNLSLVAYGGIDLTEAQPSTATVSGGSASGDVALTAVGAAASISASRNVNAISAAAGKITLSAGQDLRFGQGAGFDNDIRASGAITMTAGRDVLIDGAANVRSDGFGQDTGGGLAVTAGGEIHVFDTFGTTASIGAGGAAGADVRLTASALYLGAQTAAAVFSTSGDVLIETDALFMEADSGISANAGTVTIRPLTPGRLLNLAASNPPTALSVSDAELNRIFAPELIIGSATTGAITVAASSLADNVMDLTLQSASKIVVNTNAALQANGDLTLISGGDVIALPNSSLDAISGAIRIFVDVGAGDPGVGARALISTPFTGQLYITGNDDSDTLVSSLAADTLDGGGGADTLQGGAGEDTYLVTTGDLVIELAGGGNDTVVSADSWILAAEVESLILTGSGDASGTGNAADNLITGNAGGNALTGGQGVDTLNGGDGADVLGGGKDRDRLNGGDGADTLAGGEKNDRLIGGAGADFFLFDTAPNSASNTDEILDYDVAQDTVLLDNAVFSVLAAGTLANANFRVGAAAADGNDFIIYNSATGALLYDADGSGGGAAVQFASVDTGLAMTRLDFVVV